MENIETQNTTTSEVHQTEASESASTSTILMNVWFQLINLVVFFVIFYFLFGKKIADALSKRKENIEKIKNADEEYSSIIQKANQEKTSIIDEALTRKDSILAEAKTLAEKEKTKIIDSANKKAEDIVSSAQVQASELQRQLEQSWTEWVKSTVKVVIKKMFSENADLQEKYLDSLIANLKK